MVERFPQGRPGDYRTIHTFGAQLQRVGEVESCVLLGVRAIGEELFKLFVRPRKSIMVWKTLFFFFFFFFF